MLFAGRFPDLGLQVSFTDGRSWDFFIIDTSAFMANGAMLEIRPDEVLFIYGGNPQMAVHGLRMQLIKVDRAAKRAWPVPLNRSDASVSDMLLPSATTAELRRPVVRVPVATDDALCGAAGRDELYASSWAMTCGGDPAKNQLRCKNYSNIVVPVVLPTATAIAGSEGMDFGTLANQTVPMLLTNELGLRGWTIQGFENCKARPIGRACPGYYPSGVSSWLWGTATQPEGHRVMRIYGTDGAALLLAGGDLDADGRVIPGPDNILAGWNTTSACAGSFSNWLWKGRAAPWPGVWADHAAARLGAQSELLFKAYSEAGGELDEIIQDTELGPLFSSAYVAFSMEPSPAADACARERWNAIANDARFPPVLEELVNRGLRVNLSASQFLADAMAAGNADTERQRIIWDSVMMERAALVWETAFIQPARKFFPRLTGSNYDYKKWSGDFCVPRDNGWMFCAAGQGGAASGGESTTPMYNGFYPAVESVLRLHYGVRNYSLAPFNVMRFAGMQGRGLVVGGMQAQPATQVKPWITYSSYHHGAIEKWSKSAFGDHYIEQLFHLGCTQINGFHYFNPIGQLDNSMPTLDDHNLLQNALDEMNGLLGCAGREWVQDLNMRWADGFFLTGIRAGARTVWRFSPQHPQATRIVVEGGTAIISADNFQLPQGGHEDCTLEFQGAAAPVQSGLSKSGWWVLQNSSGVELVCASFRSRWPLPRHVRGPELPQKHDVEASVDLRLKTLDEQFAAGIARPALPTMGWRSWNWFACDIDQEIMERQAEAMVATPPWADKSLLQLGYSTIGLDDCYQSCTGPDGSFHDPEANGAPIINQSKFPSLSDMTAKARALGLRPGFYGDNCHCHQGEKKAGVTHYVQDVALTLAAGFEGTKIDSCGNQRDMSIYAAQFALRNSSMLVESCGNGPPGSNPKNDFPPHPSYLRMLESTCPFSFYRVSVDLAPQFLSCVYNLNRALPFLDAEAPLSRPGCWAYADMSMVGVDVPRHSDQPHYDNDTMTWIEWRSHFA